MKDNNYSGFVKQELIGHGQFGKVYKCVYEDTGLCLAMKKISIRKEVYDDVTREVMHLAAIDPCERLVQFYGSVRHKDNVLIFLEYVAKGSLLDYIKSKGTLDESETAIMTKQILDGIEYLHRHKLIHRDIKSANILLDDQCNAKLADFGLTQIVEGLSVMNEHSCVGTVRYMAPEVIKYEEYNSKVDIWSLGVTVVEMITGSPIYPNLDQHAFMLLIMKDQPIECNLPSTASSALKYFLMLTFTLRSHLRPGFRDMQNTKFILNARCDNNNNL